jgi:pheromone shutdown protein TraB
MRLTIVPVAHISRKSAELVRETIELEKPQLVGLELCRERLEAIVKGGPRTMDPWTAVTHPTSALLFSAQQLLGRWWGINPGGEMMEAVRAAGDTGKPVALLDRPIRAIARDIEKIPLREKLGMVFTGGIPGKKMGLNELMKPENLNALLGKMEKDFPVSYRVFVDSRNRHMFRKLLFHKPESAVIVVGAAHVPGIAKLAEESGEKISVKVVG